MSGNNRWPAAAFTALVLVLGGCAQQQGAVEEPDRAAQVEAIPSTDLSKVTLTAQAITRLGLKTEPVRKAPASPAGDVGAVSYAAVLYDATGAAWVYTTVAPRSFVRAPIVVDRVEGEIAYLRRGPAVGSVVVTVGVPELYGAEYGVGGE